MSVFTTALSLRLKIPLFFLAFNWGDAAMQGSPDFEVL